MKNAKIMRRAVLQKIRFYHLANYMRRTTATQLMQKYNLTFAVIVFAVIIVNYKKIIMHTLTIILKMCQVKPNMPPPKCE